MTIATSKSTPAAPTTGGTGALLAGAALALVAFHLCGAWFLDGFALDLGSINSPTPRYLTFVKVWMVCGTLSAALLALAVSRYLGASHRIERLIAQSTAISDRRFLIGTCAAAFVIPLVLRFALLCGAPLADDESAYRFAAQLLTSGRLWAPSPELKLFFDQNFMINDGRLYPMYFLGWPALLTAGIWMKAPGVVNPLLSALTVPPLLGILRHFAGPAWARAGIVLFLTAPFIQVTAATGLSHTSCLMALTWCLFLYLRTRDSDASIRHHAGFAFFLALAFCIRPQSALPIGVPLVISWAVTLRSLDARGRARAALAFLLPAAALAALFLGSLWLQTGSPWRTGYARYVDYVVENGYRFTGFGPGDRSTVSFDVGNVDLALARALAGLVRLNFDLFGWPASFVLLGFALPGRAMRTHILWAMTGAFVFWMLFQPDSGFDTFGPVHAFELALPVLVLTICGARQLGRRETPALAASLVGALIATAWLGFVPVRFAAMRQIAAHVSRALQAPERSDLHRAVIFAPVPIAPPCGAVPNHHVFFRPTNDPDLHNDVLWVNDVNIDDNRRLIQSLPGRTGYLLRWNAECRVVLLPLTTSGPQQ